MDYPAVTDSINKQIAASEENLDYVEYRIIRKDGSVRWVDDYGHYTETEAYEREKIRAMDGYAAAKAIRGLENRQLAEIPILAMTANAFKEDEETALAAGMQAHIAKPVDVNILLSKLYEVLFTDDSQRRDKQP